MMSDPNAWGRLKRAAQITCGVCVLVSCAHNAPVPPEEQVRERATRYYEALSQGDYEAALKYVTPGYRNTAQADRYHVKYSASPRWISTEVIKVNCGEESPPTRCVVRTSILAELHKQFPPLSTPVDSIWLNIDSQWYRYEE